MSLNAGINATIALIENRPEQFKEMLRTQLSDVTDISAVRMRLNQALDFFAATKIRGGLMDSLHAQPCELAVTTNQVVYDRGFYAGVRAVEKVFEDLLIKLEQK